MEGIRITPPVVEFHDVSADIVYQIALSIQNVSKSLKKIKVHAPTSEVRPWEGIFLYLFILYLQVVATFLFAFALFV